jgi:hypothetical protein
MTIRDDHHVTDTEDAAFDTTMKIMGVAIGCHCGHGLVVCLRVVAPRHETGRRPPQLAASTLTGPIPRKLYAAA